MGPVIAAWVHSSFFASAETNEINDKGQLFRLSEHVLQKSKMKERWFYVEKEMKQAPLVHSLSSGR